MLERVAESWMHSSKSGKPDNEGYIATGSRRLSRGLAGPVLHKRREDSVQVRGQVVSIPFPFADLKAAKLRPALVVMEVEEDCVVIFSLTIRLH